MRGLSWAVVLFAAIGATGCAGGFTQGIPDDDGARAPYDAKPTWSPDGTKIAFYRGDRKALFVIDVRTRDERELLGGLNWNDEYAWSPDGRRLVVSSRRDGVNSPRCYGTEPCPELYIVAANGGSPRRITDNRTDEQALRWSPDGRYVAYFATHDPSDSRVWRDVSIVHVRSAKERRLADDASIEHEMRWEGERALIVMADDGARSRLFLDGRREELTPSAAPKFIGRQHRPGRSSSGAVAYFSTRDNNGRSCFADSGPPQCDPNAELYLRLPDGRRLRITHTRVDETDEAWSPDGHTLAFTSGGQLWLLDADGSGLRKLTG